MLKIIRVALLSVMVLSLPKLAQAFNLLTDIKEQTQWTLGSAVSAGTAVAMRHDDSLDVRAGQFIGSALAQVSNYRMLSFWAGGNFIPINNGSTMKAVETAKFGFNMGYLLKGFAHQPPDIIKNLVFGPSVSMPIWTSPHVVIPFFDVNYAFAGTGGAAGTLGGKDPLPTTPQPTAWGPRPAFASRLNLIPAI